MIVTQTEKTEPKKTEEEEKGHADNDSNAKQTMKTGFNTSSGLSSTQPEPQADRTDTSKYFGPNGSGSEYQDGSSKTASSSPSVMPKVITGLPLINVQQFKMQEHVGGEGEREGSCTGNGADSDAGDEDSDEEMDN